MATAHMGILFALIAISVLAFAGCHQQNPRSFSADISAASMVPGTPALSGKLYVNGSHLRADWGPFADIFDMKQRTGWRVIPESRVYEELGTKELSTYAPEMTDGSLCPHAQVPSACKLVGDETIQGRKAKKWDVYNPNRFHVSFWTDASTGITLRMAIGDAASYEVKNLRRQSVPDSMFELPAGYTKMERPFKPWQR